MENGKLQKNQPVPNTERKNASVNGVMNMRSMSSIRQDISTQRSSIRKLQPAREKVILVICTVRIAV